MTAGFLIAVRFQNSFLIRELPFSDSRRNPLDRVPHGPETVIGSLSLVDGDT